MEQPRATDGTDILWEVGERIEALLNASSANGAIARERSEELVRQVTSLYGEGLARVLRILDAARVLNPRVWDALVEDEVVAGLLLIHGLHPYDVRTRVESALESVRPYLGTHGGDVELLDVTEDGVVALRLLGSCDGCPSSSVTLELAVESAVAAAAPEVTSIHVSTGAKATGEVKPGQAVDSTKAQPGGPIIPVSALRSRLDSDGAPRGHWAALPQLADLAAGEVGGFSVSGTDLLVCRIGSDLFAFADRCPRCEQTMRGARLERRAGAPVGSGVLTCPTCRSHYDVRQAGAGIDTTNGDGSHPAQGDRFHLAPFPVLLRDDVFSVALPAYASTTAPEPVAAP